jgi:hypothetical protein
MSRVDLATEAQTPVDFDPTSIRTLGEPQLGSVHIGVQPGGAAISTADCLHPSSRRSHPDTVCLCLLRQVRPDLRNVFYRKRFNNSNSYAKPSVDLAR